MTELPPKPSSSKTTVGTFATLLISKQLRWAYGLVVTFLVLVGAAFFASGWVLFDTSRRDEFRIGLPTSLICLSVGLLLMIAAVVLFQSRRYLALARDATVNTIAEAELGKLNEDDFEHFERVRKLHEDKAQFEFQKNLSAILVVEQFKANEVTLFRDISWSLQPGVNVLLGRNGYGKSLILRALAGALQRHENSTDALLRARGEDDASVIEVRLKRNGEPVQIRKNALRFTDSVGKVPILAIPDSRFFDRSQTSIGPNDSDRAELRVDGAYHFLNQLPYGAVIQGLLYEICLDYWEHGKRFDLPVFQFFRECVRRLTGYSFSFDSIERQGRTGFEIKVITEGTEEPLPIQYASQGTLSVLAMFGLIRSYVGAIAGNSEDKDGVQHGSAIVLIDEADAHLHPAWQQKFPTLLRDLFPNVQFILSAHSPLFVAGCWNGEVAVLRRLSPSPGSGFLIEQPNRDFLGASPAELYDQIFEIEKADDTFLEYSKKATQTTLREQLDREVEALAQKQETTGTALDPEQEEHLSKMIEEKRRIARAVEVAAKRRNEITKDVRIVQLESQIAALKTRGQEHL